jgi:hypothetical protein
MGLKSKVPYECKQKISIVSVKRVMHDSQCKTACDVWQSMTQNADVVQLITGFG